VQHWTAALICGRGGNQHRKSAFYLWPLDPKVLHNSSKKRERKQFRPKQNETKHEKRAIHLIPLATVPLQELHLLHEFAGEFYGHGFKKILKKKRKKKKKEKSTLSPLLLCRNCTCCTNLRASSMAKRSGPCCWASCGRRPSSHQSVSNCTVLLSTVVYCTVLYCNEL